MANLNFDVTATNTQFLQAMQGVQDSVRQMSKQIQAEAATMDRIFTTVGASMAGAFSAYKLKEFANSVIETRKEFQSLQVSFQSLLGSDIAGTKMFNDITKFATSTPLLERDLANAAKTLLGFNIEAEKVVPTLKMIGDVSMGDSGKFQSLVLAFSQASSAGKLMGQDLLQMINAGFNPLGEMARTTGKSMAQLKEEMSEGKISAEMLEGAFKSATSEGGKFNGMLLAQSKTLAGAESNLEGAIQKFQNALGEHFEHYIVDATNAAYDGVNKLTEFMEGNDYGVGHIEAVGDAILGIIAIVGEWKAAQIVVGTYNSMIAEQELAIQAQRQQALADLVAELEAEAAGTANGTAATQASNEAKREALSLEEQQIQAIIQKMEVELAEAEAAETSAYNAKSIAEARLGMREQELEDAQASLNAAYELGDATAIEAAEEKAAIAAAEVSTAQRELNTAATDLNAASKTREAAATRLSTTQTKVDTIAKEANTKTTGLMAAVTGAATKAWNALKVAMATNPFGVALVAITTLITAMSMFEDETQGVNAEMERFGKTALKEAQKVDTLLSVIRATSSDSQVHKNAIDELTKIYGQYGIHLDNEKDVVTQLIDLHDQLRNAIKKEGEERKKANILAAYEEASNKAIEKLNEELANTLSKAQFESWNIDASGRETRSMWNADKVRESAEEITSVMSAIAQNEAAELTHIIEQGYNITDERRRMTLENIKKSTEQTLRSMGLWDENAQNLKLNYEKVFGAMIDKTIALAMAQRETTKSAERAKEANEANNDSMKDAADNIDTLIGKLASTVGKNTDVKESADDASSAVNNLGNQVATPDVDTTNIEKAKDKVDETDKKLNTVNDFIVVPKINTTPVDILNTKLQGSLKLMQKVSGLGGDYSPGWFARGTGNNAPTNVDSDTKSATETFSTYIKRIGEELRSNKYTNNKLSEILKGVKEAKGNAIAGSSEDKQLDELINTITGMQGKGSRKGSKKTGSKRDPAVKIADEQKRLLDLQEDLARQRQRTAEDLETEITNARLTVMENGAAKVRALQNEEHKEELDRIRRQKKDAIKEYIDGEEKLFDQQEKIKKAKDKNYKVQAFDRNSVNTSAIAQQYDTILKYTQMAQQKTMAEAEQVALNQYLQQYGSYEQKKLAIAQDYAERIKQANTEAEKLSLQAQLQSAQQALTSEHNKKLLGFEDLFANIESMTVTQLQSIKDRLNELMASGTLSLSDYKDAAQQIDGINSAIIAAQDQEKGLLGGIIQQSVERRKIEMDIADAKQRQNDLTTQQAQAQARVDQLRGSLQQATGVKNVSVDNQAAVLGMAKAIYGEDSPQYQQVLKGMQELAEAERHLNDVTEQKTKTDNDLANAEQRLSKYMGDLQKRVADFAASLEGVNTNIQSLPGLFESLGFDSESGVGKVVNDLAEGANAGMNAMKDFASGNYIGAAKNALDAIGSFGRMGIGIFAGQGNVKAKEEEIEKLSKSNDQLARSIEGLKDSITDADATNEQSVEAYKKARDAEQEWTANMQKMINDRSSEYSNSGHGFLGLKGRKSFNHYLDARGAGWWGWAQFNAALSANGSKNTVNSAAELWSLSPEEMKVLRDFAPAAWAEMLKTKGEANPEELLNDYIDHAGMADSLIDALNEKLTGYSWDGFRDSFSSMLKDLGSDITDFANFIDEVIANALIEAFVADQLSPRIKNLQQMIADAAEHGIIDATEQAAIHAENNAIATDALNWRNNMEALGLIKRQQDEQQATANGASQITYDQANLLVGRVTALQIQGEQRNGMLSTVVESMNNLASAALVSGSSVEDMRNLMVINNSYLEDISKYTKRIYNEFNAQLVQLNNNIKSL